MAPRRTRFRGPATASSLVPAHGLGGRLRAPSARVLWDRSEHRRSQSASSISARARRRSSRSRSWRSPACRRRCSGPSKLPRSRYVGESLVALDQDEGAGSSSCSRPFAPVSLDRAFPHSAPHLRSCPSVPWPSCGAGPDAWLVSEHGRVIRELDRGRRNARTNVWVGLRHEHRRRCDLSRTPKCPRNPRRPATGSGQPFPRG